MSSRMLLRAATRTRLAFPNTQTANRAYATAAQATSRTASTTPRTATRTSTSRATDPPGKGKTDIADEVEIPPEAYGSQPESIPSSSVLQASSAPPDVSPSLSSYAPIDFAESATISGSPKDPNSPDWSKSYFGLSTQPFPKEAAETLLAPVDPMDVEIKPDGLIYLPEIKYRRVLNRAFGPGGWGLAPRSETNVGPRVVSREYALVCLGRLVGIARGEQEYFDPNGIPTATEACKSNALMRCCKDLGIASELWDPRFIREFKAKHCVEVFVEDTRTKKKRKLWRRKDQPPFEYPFKET
ncbi:mitochondrial genome maintenance MGM101-domain-containing protein [Dichomitus squalens]|uniref:Mitochondrial genome maintenance protein MGM101 n=1 Tax=Dichomitus squalens TaxID=114155 RepID=A0A4Q9NJI7_9APHY|nr:mitochondrial genome maintenance MGM101-domain-containing protein [Dichomitus squalens]TBU41459.1 mitochondrial genome maintenance MGM101-domain-containing protein [Dichomitus squalens]TBU63219.1 mitochondrial genome maintenance MGM101-domain-containing protein [Dichomitus squalens]